MQHTHTHARTRVCGRDTPTACVLRPWAQAEDRCHQQRSVQLSEKETHPTQLQNTLELQVFLMPTPIYSCCKSELDSKK